MNHVVRRSYLSKSLSNLGVPTSPENMPLEMSSGESSPPYDPSQPATASMSMPMEQKISFSAIHPTFPFRLPLLSDQSHSTRDRRSRSTRDTIPRIPARRLIGAPGTGNIFVRPIRGKWDEIGG